MWKFVTRGFRETFERGLNIGRNDVRVNRETTKTTYCCQNTRPCFLDIYRLNHNCRQGGKQSDGPKQKNNRGFYGSQDPYDSWLGAVSCSSAIALGWVLTQPSYWKRWLAEKTKCPVNKKCSLVEILGKVAFAQPVQALPKRQTTTLQPILLANEDDLIEDNDNTVYGPKTGDEAFNEAAGNFLHVHNSIIGEVENKKAVALIEGNRQDANKAMKLFLSASKKGYLPAMYNIGQCFEMGIGTKQDFVQAAKWYQKAADGGHPTSMYNLGVFHAHGWGGMVADTQKARNWLEAAAKLGQPDAASALGIKTPPSSPSVPDIPKGDWAFVESHLPFDIVSNDSNELFNLASLYEKNPCEDSTLPPLIVELYKMASDLGHTEAKSKYTLLHAYERVGLLTEYLCGGNKPSPGCFTNISIPPVF